jgi:CheY-like chemotaxis protein
MQAFLSDQAGTATRRCNTALRDIRELLDREIPIIAMTTNALEQDRDRCVDAGLVDSSHKACTIRSIGINA